MANPIYTNDIFDDSKIERAIKQTQDIENGLKSTVKQAETLLKTLSKLNFLKQGDKLNKMALATEQLEVKKNALDAAHKKEIASLKRLKSDRDKVIKANTKEAETISKINKQYKDQTTFLGRLRLRLTQFTSSQKQSNPVARNMVAQSKALNQSLKTQSGIIGVNAKKTKLSTGVFKQFTSSLRNLIGVYVSLIGLQRLFSSVFSVTRELDSVSFILKAVIQDQKELTQTTGFLNDITSRYGVNILTASKSYAKFRAATKSTNLTTKETQDIFESFC